MPETNSWPHLKGLWDWVKVICCPKYTDIKTHGYFLPDQKLSSSESSKDLAHCPHQGLPQVHSKKTQSSENTPKKVIRKQPIWIIYCPMEVSQQILAMQTLRKYLCGSWWLLGQEDCPLSSFLPADKAKLHVRQLLDKLGKKLWHWIRTGYVSPALGSKPCICYQPGLPSLGLSSWVCAIMA